MDGNTLFRPMAAAFAWGLRLPSLVALALLIASAAGYRALQTQLIASAGSENFIWISLLVSFGPAVVNAVIVYGLARTLLAGENGHSRPFLLRALGLYLMAVGITSIVSGVGTIALVSGDPSPSMMTYGSALVGPLGAILTFPILVRVFATAAGIAEPTLGSLWAFVFDDGRYAYLWYAVCSVLLPLLVVFTFTSLLPTGGEANELPRNLVASAITGTGAWLRYMLAIVVVQMAAPTNRSTAEVFA